MGWQVMNTLLIVFVCLQLRMKGWSERVFVVQYSNRFAGGGLQNTLNVLRYLDQEKE